MRYLACLVGLSSVCGDPLPRENILRVAEIIARLEGYYDPQSLCARLRNPGCLIYSGQAGARAGSQGYAEFGKRSDGWEALLNDLRAKARRGLSLSQIIDLWTRHPVARERYRRAMREAGLL